MQQHVFNGTIWVPVTDEEHRADPDPHPGVVVLEGDSRVFTPAAYYGYTEMAPTWGSATWVAAIAAPPLSAATWVDPISTGISRSSSNFTFTEAGIYCSNGCANYAHLANTKFFQMRLRDTGAGTTSILYSNAANGGNLSTLVLAGIFEVTAGQTLQLQYVTSDNAQTAAWGPQANDGETTRTVYYGIHRIG